MFIPKIGKIATVSKESIYVKLNRVEYKKTQYYSRRRRAGVE